MNHPVKQNYFDVHTHKPLIVDAQLRNIELRDFMKCFADFDCMSVGVHPWLVQEYDDETCFQELADCAKKVSVLALGETGLDRMHFETFSRQQAFLNQHIALSEKLNKPLILHCVRAYADILPLRKGKSMPWILHGYLGNIQQTQQLLAKDFLFSFNERSLAYQKTVESLRMLPLESIFIETDESDLPIECMYFKVAKLLACDEEKLRSTIEENFKRVFNSSY